MFEKSAWKLNDRARSRAGSRDAAAAAAACGEECTPESSSARARAGIAVAAAAAGGVKAERIVMEAGTTIEDAARAEVASGGGEDVPEEKKVGFFGFFSLCFCL